MREVHRRNRLTSLALCSILASCALFLPPKPSPTPVGEPSLAVIGELVDPEIGVRYPFGIGTHCGLDAAQIDGDVWLFDGEPTPNPPPGFGNPFDVGQIVLIDPNHAVYTSSAGVRVQLTRGGEPRNRVCF